MEQQYESHGIRFLFPRGWELNEDASEDEVHINLAGPETSFWLLTLMFDRPDAAHVIETAIDAFRQEYAEVDIYTTRAVLCDRTAIARDIEFVCLELINSASLRAFETSRFTALVLYQATDHDLAATREIFEQITASLACTAPDDLLFP